jgi:transposase
MKMKVPYENVQRLLEEAKSAMKTTKEKRMFERYQCIFLYLSGERRESIATILNRSLDTVGNYIRAYHAKGLKGLDMGYSPGRPHQLTEDQEQELYRIVADQTPADVGFPANMNWTSFLVRDWIQNHFGITYSDRGVRQLLRRLGFSYTKPTYTLAKADPQKQEAFKQDFEAVKKITTARN